MILTTLQNVSNLRHWPVAASCNKVTFLTKDIANNFDPWQKCKATLIYNWSCKDGRWLLIAVFINLQKSATRNIGRWPISQKVSFSLWQQYICSCFQKSILDPRVSHQMIGDLIHFKFWERWPFYRKETQKLILGQLELKTFHNFTFCFSFGGRVQSRVLVTSSSTLKLY